ncbi:unnamed protein product [Didymodactylos carnosus]|uniref:HMG box domain-containing protein n=1 Tax=Didymodactylos carnosus TaxID=1234261 RepID=A0A813V2G9_9BILA|nr:unnamed protein product [Didymodactylos carnosus]CAF0857497.1 unnamed protein product [Didymodactylos carnosus]CAF3626116.1 unnamed protein product [Didymodactylos carnosus]CAF3642463.1 unnamed protein product [Didymodactylos carnosus]
MIFSFLDDCRYLLLVINFIMPKPRDANKPRGPVTAYALFVRTCREELRRKFPQLQVDYNVISKRCSERWKQMSDCEKKRFNDTAETQRKRYKEEMVHYNAELAKAAAAVQQTTNQQSTVTQQPTTIMNSYDLTNHHFQPSTTQNIHQLTTIPTTTSLTPAQSLPSLPSLGLNNNNNPQNEINQSLQHHQQLPPPPTKKTQRKRERKPKDPLAPKKPLSAYFLFCADERPKVHVLLPGLSVSDVAKELGNRWKKALPDVKQKYEQQANENKSKYQIELNKYKQQSVSSPNSVPPGTMSTLNIPQNNNNNEFQSQSQMNFSQQQQQQTLQFPFQQQQHQNFLIDQDDFNQSNGVTSVGITDHFNDDDDMDNGHDDFIPGVGDDD